MQRLYGHEIVFRGAETTSVQDVAASLVANEQILLHIGAVLEELFSGLTVEKVTVQFRYVSINSPLREMLVVALVTAYQEQLGIVTKEIVSELTGYQLGDKGAVVVTILFFILLIYGVDWAYKKFKGTKPDDQKGQGSLAITGDYNTVLQVGGHALGVSPEKLANAVEAAIKPTVRDSLAKKALHFIRPAKESPGASIEGGGVALSAQSVADAPSDIDMELATEEEQHSDYPKCQIDIHATDRDRTKSGWAAHVPGIWDKRVRMQIYPTIDPKEVFGKTSIVGDIILSSRRNAAGEMQPYLLHLVKLYPDEDR